MGRRMFIAMSTTRPLVTIWWRRVVLRGCSCFFSHTSATSIGTASSNNTYPKDPLWANNDGTYKCISTHITDTYVLLTGVVMCCGNHLQVTRALCDWERLHRSTRPLGAMKRRGAIGGDWTWWHRRILMWTACKARALTYLWMWAL